MPCQHLSCLSLLRQGNKTIAAIFIHRRLTLKGCWKRREVQAGRQGADSLPSLSAGSDKLPEGRLKIALRQKPHEGRALILEKYTPW